VERLQQIEEIFQEALQRAPAERDTFVREACRGDSDLRREVASLLANHHEGIDSASWAAAAAAELIVDRASLQPGQCLGPYRIEGFLAAGGMGEVYRATDNRLHREVAIKVSAARFSERFEREARVIASLNHPNICTLYDVGPNYLVMEYVEGPTLAERIHQGPIPTASVLDIARQMTAALEAAHQRLIVHRDFKPGNVKIRHDGTVKVLDFGLAKLPPAQTGASAHSDDSPTLTIAATQAGVLLGTAAYMSPEQARGEPVDKRGDVWAFGVVLWEMLTGKRLFQGKTTSDVLAAVIRDEPDLRQVPAKVRPLLKRCLEKDPQKRLRDIGDAMGIIESTPSSESATRPASSRLVWILTAVAAVLAVALAALSFIHFHETPPRAEVIRFQIPGPRAHNFIPAPWMSPNGRMIAFSAQGPAGRNVLWVRSLDAVDARALAGTEDAGDRSFWSPDSRFIGFTAQGKLKKVAASGGPVEVLCDTPGLLPSAAWSPNGVIIFGSQGHGLMRVSESGGALSPLTVFDPSRESLHGSPAFLPDGRHFIYSRVSARAEYSGLYIGSLDASPEQQGSRRVMAALSSATYARSVDADLGYVLFVRDGVLMAQPFNNRRMEMAGEAVRIADGFDQSGQRAFSVSENGVLAYRTGNTFPTTQLSWFDRTGKTLGPVAEAGKYNSVALSPDGTRMAVSKGSGLMDIWVYEFVHGHSQRLTFEPARHFMAVWSPDGSRIAFTSNPAGIFDLYQKASSGVGNEDLLLQSNEAKYPYDWSSDGRWLLYGVLAGPLNLWLLPLVGDDRKPMHYLTSQYNQSQARFSPDGRYVAYTSDETGKNEVYVQPLPQPSGGKWPVSKGGGNQPLWRRDGKELFYVSADSKMMAVDVSTTPVFSSGNPKALFAAPVWGGATSPNVTRYGVTPDGKRFLINTLTADTAAPASPITVVLNWQIGLKK
jgi:serine/threonine protein kinase/Tol biopolymer transport system component